MGGFIAHALEFGRGWVSGWRSTIEAQADGRGVYVVMPTHGTNMVGLPWFLIGAVHESYYASWKAKGLGSFGTWVSTRGRVHGTVIRPPPSDSGSSSPVVRL